MGSFFSLDGQWGASKLVIIALVIWIAYRILSHIGFGRYLGSIDHPNQRRRIFPLNFLIASTERKLVGRAWLLRHSQISVIFVAFVLLILSGYRAWVTHHAMEFARAGALITVGGLSSLLIGYLEDKRREADWATILVKIEAGNLGMSFNDLMADSKDGAQRRVQVTSFIVSMIGTLVWAYGDQLLACGVFPSFGLKDLSGVTCFCTSKC